MNRSIEYKRVKTNKPDTFIIATLYYTKGGVSLSGEQEQRGLWVSVSPAEIKDGWKKVTAYSGTRQFKLSLSRYSEKKLDNFVVDNVDELIQYVADKNGLKVEL